MMRRSYSQQVYVSGRIKTMNESIYYTVDAIHNAISENKKIRFPVFSAECQKKWNLGIMDIGITSVPWGLSWDDENYYLVGYDTDAGMIKHYRVDKMLHIKISDELRGKNTLKAGYAWDYAKKSFEQVRRKEQTEKIKLSVHNKLSGVIIDRFGKDVMMIPADEEHFNVNVDVR